MASGDNLPTLILVHGSWHRPICFDPLLPHLTPSPFSRCISISLPSSNSFSAEPTFSDDLAAATAAISSEVNSGRDVVVIAHSYGGMVGSSAIRDFINSSGPSKGKVIGLILIASGFPLTGHSMLSLFFGLSPPGQRINRTTGFQELTNSPKDMFYHDVYPEEEAKYWVEQLTTQSLKALTEGGELVYSGWRDVPTWYLGTSEDRALPVFIQRFTVGLARGMNGGGTMQSIEHREVPSSHSPFLSMPGTTARVVREAVGAFMGRKVLAAKGEEEKEEGVVVVVPGVQLWRLGTWFKFGIPLGFGFILGRGILFFSWMRRSLFGWFF